MLLNWEGQPQGRRSRSRRPNGCSSGGSRTFSPIAVGGLGASLVVEEERLVAGGKSDDGLNRTNRTGLRRSPDSPDSQRSARGPRRPRSDGCGRVARLGPRRRAGSRRVLHDGEGALLDRDLCPDVTGRPRRNARTARLDAGPSCRDRPDPGRRWNTADLRRDRASGRRRPLAGGRRPRTGDRCELRAVPQPLDRGGRRPARQFTGRPDLLDHIDRRFRPPDAWLAQRGGPMGHRRHERRCPARCDRRGQRRRPDGSAAPDRARTRAPRASAPGRSDRAAVLRSSPSDCRGGGFGHHSARPSSVPTRHGSTVTSTPD